MPLQMRPSPLSLSPDSHGTRLSLSSGLQARRLELRLLMNHVLWGVGIGLILSLSTLGYKVSLNERTAGTQHGALGSSSHHSARPAWRFGIIKQHCGALFQKPTACVCSLS